MFWFLLVTSVFASVPEFRHDFHRDAFFGVGSSSRARFAPVDLVSSECTDLTGDYYTHNPDDGTLKTVSIQQTNCLNMEVSSREGCFSETYKLRLDGQKYPATENQGEVNFITASWRERQLLVIFESNFVDDPATYINYYRLDENTNLVRRTLIVDRTGAATSLPDDVFIRFRPQYVFPLAME